MSLPSPALSLPQEAGQALRGNQKPNMALGRLAWCPGCGEENPQLFILYWKCISSIT